MESVVESNGNKELNVEERILRPLHTIVLVVLVVVMCDEFFTNCLRSCVMNVLECFVNSLNCVEVL